MQGSDNQRIGSRIILLIVGLFSLLVGLFLVASVLETPSRLFDTTEDLVLVGARVLSFPITLGAAFMIVVSFDRKLIASFSLLLYGILLLILIAFVPVLGFGALLGAAMGSGAPNADGLASGTLFVLSIPVVLCLAIFLSFRTIYIIRKEIQTAPR